MGRPAGVSAPSFWEWLSAFPPIVVRLAARRVVTGKHVVSLSHQEIAITSDIPLTRILRISESLSWDGLTIGEARAFCAACRFDPTNFDDRKRQAEYVRQCQNKRRPPQYLRNSPLWEEQFLPLILRLKSHRTSLIDSVPSQSRETKCAA